jgi:hypothetical protein
MLPDLFNHIGRYHVMIHGESDPFLARYYDFKWQLVGNLGIDLPMLVLGPVLGTELAARLLVATIPPLNVWAIYRLSRAAHGAVQPSAFLALPLIYSFPFLHGFVNFALASALALLALPVWARLSDKSWVVQVLAGCAMALVVWVAHVAGWAILLVLAGSWALMQAILSEGLSVRALIAATLRVVPLAMPLVPTLLWRSGSGVALSMFSLSQKVHGVANLLRGESTALDIASVLIILACLAWLLFDRRIIKSKPLLLGGFLLSFFVLILPSYVFSSFYADVRLLPAALTVLLISAGSLPRKAGLALAIIGCALFVIRLGVHGWGWHERGNRIVADLHALDAVPKGARIAVIAERTLCNGWVLTGLDRVPSLAIVRISAFVNTQWDMADQQLMTPLYNKDVGYHAPPSNLLATPGNACEGRALGEILTTLPRKRFDYVWIFSRPAKDSRIAWLKLEAQTPDARLYRISRR